MPGCPKCGRTVLPDRIAWSVPEAARLIGVSPNHLRNEVSAGRIRSIRSGSRRLIEAAELDRYLAAARRTAA